jgi:mRNA interferase HigB
MRVIAVRTLREFWELHPQAEQPLRAWYQDAHMSVWQSPHAVKQSYANASIINDERVVFNIKGNSYRLIVAINYLQQSVFIKFVGTHAEYDKVDAAQVEYRE